MIESLEIRGYRCFEALKVEGLTQVSLFVGPNNAGKTSLLDALELLLLRDNETSIFRSLWRRQEVQSRLPDPTKTTGADISFDARQLFNGRKLGPGKSFSIKGGSPNGAMKFTASVRSSERTGGRALTIETEQPRKNGRIFDLSQDALAWESGYRDRRPDELIRPFVFVTPSGIGARERALLWDAIVGNDDEDRVTHALRILEPRIERIVFTVGDHYSNAPAPFVRMQGLSERIPLGNFGHGASRLLDLAVLLTQARGGAFLVDEIEVGLHHSVMEPVWKLVIETARRLDIQVFATTHSHDCLRALARLYGQDPSLLDVVSLHRLQAGGQRAERFSMDEMEIAEEAHLELRGMP